MKLFISYRRKSWTFVHSLAEKLRQRLYAEIFVDYEAVDETDFEHSIMTNLRDSDAVLVIVSEYTFAPDRIFREDDWVRREIREALSLNIPIVSVFIGGQLITEDIPADIKLIRKMQGISFHPEFFDAAVEKLANFITKATPIEAIERTAQEIYIQTTMENSRRTLYAALEALNSGDHPKFYALLAEVQVLLKSVREIATDLTESIVPGTALAPPPADTPSEPPAPRDPLDHLNDLAAPDAAHRTPTEILNWLYPRPPADNAP